MRVFLFFLIFLSLLHAGISKPNTAVKKSPFIPDGMLNSTFFELFEKEFKILGTMGFCEFDDVEESVYGSNAQLIEPMYVAEVVREPFKFEMLYTDTKPSEAQLKKLGANHEDGMQYMHIFKFPFMAMIIGKKSKGVFCLAEPNPSVLYVGELDVTSNKDYLRLKLLPEMANFITVQGIIATITDCIAAETVNKLDYSKRRKKYYSYLNDTRDLFFYANGCTGLNAIGSNNTHNQDPFMNALNMITSELSFFAKVGMIDQTVKSILNTSKKDIWCKPLKGPRIKWQFVPQLVRPTRGYPFEFGASSITWSSFKNDGTTGGNSVFLIWQRRDYRMLAYENCE